MTVLVIGGTGFIGPHVVRRLCARGNHVIVFHRGETEAELPSTVQHLHAPRLKSGRQALNEFRAEFAQLKPDVVLDMIPSTEQDAQVLVSTFRGIAGRIVTVSSGDVYRAYGVLLGKEPGAIEPVPLTEHAPLRQNLYPYRGETRRGREDPKRWMDDYDKILVESVVMSNYDLPGTVLRLPMVYGPGDRQHRVFPYLKRMDDRRPAILLEEGMAQWIPPRGYVENAAAAIALAVADDRAANRIYNVGEVEALAEAEWIRRIGAVAGWQGEVVVLPKHALPDKLQSGMNTDQHLFMDTTRVRVELGYAEPVACDEALRRTVEWERSNPPATIDEGEFDYATEDAILRASDNTRRSEL